MRNELEHIEQVDLMHWWSLAHKQFGIPEQLLFAIPNGGQRSIVTASKLKAEGVRAGVPDLFLAYPTPHGGRGLFIEMKKPIGGRVSYNQDVMLFNLANVGYHCAICHGWLEAKDAIEKYMKGDYIGLHGPQKAHLN